MEYHEFRMMLYSSEAQWFEKVNVSGFNGIALAPRDSLKLLSPEFGGIALCLIDTHNTQAVEEGHVSIYASIDQFFILIRANTMKMTVKHGHQFMVMSFSAYVTDQLNYQRLKQLLQKSPDTPTLLELTTLRRFAGKDDQALSDWLWEEKEIMPKLEKGACYGLYHQESDLEVPLLLEWRVKFKKVLEETTHALWHWCGTEWHDLTEIAFAHTNEIIWLADNLQEIETAAQWTRELKRRKPGLTCRLVTSRATLTEQFDYHYDGLSAALEDIETGRRL